MMNLGDKEVTATKMEVFKKHFNLFQRQFRALAWKNYKLKLRNLLVLALEILVPTLIIYALSAIKGFLEPTVVPAITPTTLSGSGFVFDFADLYNQARCGDTSLVWRCTTGRRRDDDCTASTSLNMDGDVAINTCQQQFIAVAPSDPSSTNAITAATEFVSWANTEYTYTDTDSGVTLESPFEYFDSEDKFMNLLQTDTDYSFEGHIYSSAVIFNDGYPNWDYTVRLNKTFNSYSGRFFDVATEEDIPNTNNRVRTSNEYPESKFGNLPPYHQSWTQSGYVTLTNAVNRYAATKTCVESAVCSSGDTYEYNLRHINPFPSPAYTTTGFWGAVGDVFSLLMIVVLLYPLANVISTLVREKESKLREGMKMMALKPEVLWASWWFNFMALFLPLSLILTWIGGALFEYSDSNLIFLYFFCFFLSATSYAIFISAFFTNSRTAAICGSLIFFGGYFIYVGIGSSGLDRSSIMAACLHPAAAFTYSTLAFIEYEDTNMGVTSYTWNVSGDHAITFQDCLNMMVVDAIYLSFLSWYFDKIWPSEYGQQEKWYFLFTPHYWKKIFGINDESHVPELVQDNDSASNDSVNVELVSEDLMSQFESKTCIDIQNLRKSFKTPQGTKVAVDGLSLSMFQGQITALLGHNGAGKTTAIAMLTGLINADSGSAVIEGKNIAEEMDEIRTTLGVCPQHDILFPELTVEEHLNLFASFKGVTPEEIDKEVNDMIASVGLTEKRDVASKFLSGGQKRKLSVGIAFIGGSKIVILDEPTSGMDPYSRRFTWNVIRQHREGRIIVLTTHFMDEADLLGDRIAIMGDGKLCCCGSSLYLKNLYGVGYNMTLEKKSAINFNEKPVVETVKKYVQEANLITDVGTELTFQLPFTASSSFPTLFTEIENNMDKLCLESYGISVTTLEEVFIKITRNTHTNKAAQDGINNNKMAVEDDTKLVISNNDTEESAPINHTVKFEKIDENDHIRYFIQHVLALLRKRALYFIRDIKAQIFVFVIPFIFLLGGLLIMANTYPSTYQPLKQINISMYNKGITTNVLPTPVANPSKYEYTDEWSGTPVQYIRGVNAVAAAQAILDAIPNKSNFPINDIGNPNPMTPADMTTYLDTHKDDYEASQFGTCTMFNTADSKRTDFFMSTNYTAVFGVPLYQSIIADATMRALNPAASLKTSFFPLPDTKRQDDLFSNYNADLVVTFMLLSIPFVPAAWVTYLVREKEVKSKHQQMVSGVGVVAYWVSTFLWDNLSFFPLICLLAVLVAGPVFGKDTTSLGGGGSKYSAEMECFFGMLFLFGTSMTGFSYLFSFLFKAPATGQVVMIFLCFITGLVLSIVGIVLRILPDTTEAFDSYVRYLFCLFPPYALGDGLHSMTLIDVWSALERGGIKYPVRHYKITGLPMMMMGFETVFYLGLTIVIEYVASVPKVQQYIESWLNSDLPAVDETLKDDDVLHEEQLVNSGEKDDNSTILVKDLKKQYYMGIGQTGKYAVRGLSLGIPNGECFGLLGINGAGKSSTLSMLSGEFAPTAGSAYLNGLDLTTDIHTCRRKVGFCPQFDSLFELLTAREHLELYARIKGIREEYINDVVQKKIEEMGLSEYADRYAGSYSGGNKRKLSVAVAMIGEPSLVFLDEPSTGMDPVAKRFMWDVISDIVTKREKCSLILTTHSMEECEALCTRIGIMVGGVMRCLGSAQKLRTKYGNGYQIEIGMNLPTALDIEEYGKFILTELNLPKSTQKVTKLNELNGSAEEIEVFIDNIITREQTEQIFKTDRCNKEWISRLTSTDNGSDLVASFESVGSVHMKHLASWILLETQYDNIKLFLQNAFGDHIIRERQPSKIRVEISSIVSTDGKQRLLSSIFKAIEEQKGSLNIHEYSISQTSLEQIFNYFASQQEEEIGSTGAMFATNKNENENDTNSSVAGGNNMPKYAPLEVEK